MALRSIRERAYQTIAYEAGAFLIATPLYAFMAGDGATQSSLLVIAVALACMIWAPLHHTLWDWLEWRFKHRLASDRPQWLRLVHAISHEVSSIVVTTPVIMLVGGHDFWHALMVDIGLTLLYSVYAYFFHMAYDWMRPVKVVAQPAMALMQPADKKLAEPHRPTEIKRSLTRQSARRPARWAPRILPHAGLALIQARRDASSFNGF